MSACACSVQRPPRSSTSAPRISSQSSSLFEDHSVEVEDDGLDRSRRGGTSPRGTRGPGLGRRARSTSTAPMKSVWSPASCSESVRHSSQPSAPSSGARPWPGPGRVVHAGPERDRRAPPRAKCCADPVLRGAEQARRQRARHVDRLVRARSFPDRDPDKRQLERQRDERPDGEAEPLAVDLHRHDRDGGRNRRITALSSSPPSTGSMLASARAQAGGNELGIVAASRRAAESPTTRDATPVLALSSPPSRSPCSRSSSAARRSSSARGSALGPPASYSRARQPPRALHRHLRAPGGLVVVQSALVGSVLANSVLVLGLAFLVGGLRNGTQQFHSRRARMIATLTMLAARRRGANFTHAWAAPAAAPARRSA